LFALAAHQSSIGRPQAYQCERALRALVQPVNQRANSLDITREIEVVHRGADPDRAMCTSDLTSSPVGVTCEERCWFIFRLKNL
jgi:hypothetical protein